MEMRSENTTGEQAIKMQERVYDGASINRPTNSIQLLLHEETKHAILMICVVCAYFVTALQGMVPIGLT